MPRIAIIEVAVNSRNPGTAFGAGGPGETTGDPANGHFIPWHPRALLGVRNISGGALNITFTPQGTGLDIFAPPPKVISIPASAQRFFGPFASLYRQPNDSDRMYVDVESSSLRLKSYVVREG
jgi:hypothetical protein